MAFEEQFKTLILNEKSDELLSFLRKLLPEERKSISRFVKKMHDEYHQYGQLKNGSWGHIVGSQVQRNLLMMASFVCFTRKEFERTSYPAGIIDEENLKDILDWYVPDWFSDFINQQAKEEYIPFDYLWLMSLRQKGILELSKELVVKILPNIPLEYQPSTRETVYKPEKLLLHPATLQEHIWYLFELESSIHLTGRYAYSKNKKELGWDRTIMKFVIEGKIDRLRVMKEALLASNKNFNKVLSGWFIELFCELAPTDDELLIFQKELFGVLNSPHSKVVNSSLVQMKKIVSNDAFDSESFIDATAMLFSASTKSTVSSALALAEKIAKKKKELKTRIAISACAVFIHPDEELQMRGAKLIAAIGDQNDPDIKNALQPYHDTLLSEPKKIVGEFLSAVEPSTPATLPFELRSPVPQLTELPGITTVEDLAFLLSRGFENYSPSEFEQLIAGIIKFGPQIKPEHLLLLEPGLQRALKILKGDQRSNMGFLEILLACFVVDFGNHLADTFPAASDSLVKLIRQFDHKVGDDVQSWRIEPTNSSYTATLETKDRPAIYAIFRHLLLLAVDRVRRKDTLTLLSTPTHEQGWISPEVLVKRLAEYQLNQRVPDSLDLQIAIARCYLRGLQDPNHLLKQQLSGEFYNLLNYLFNDVEATGPFKFEEAWRIATILKRNQSNLHPTWELKEEEFVYKRYSYADREYVNEKSVRKSLSVTDIIHEKKAATGIRKLLSGFGKHRADEPFLFNLLKLKTLYVISEHNDVKRFLSLSPNYPDPLLVSIINLCLASPVYTGESYKKLVIATLECMSDFWPDYGELGHLFIGVCLINSDKTVANLAAEIWIRGANTAQINSGMLGEIIGKHQRIEFAPLKRFNDLVSTQLTGISRKHNQELIIIIENIVKQLPDAPVAHLKKLLDIHFELLVAEKRQVSDVEVISRLEIWKGNAGLQKTISKFSDKRA